jgi:hypothetical protein
MKGCGGCTLCCTLMKVKMDDIGEPDKPAFTKCRHECKRGCGIYERRPDLCRGFMCMWLGSQQFEGLELPKELRPDRTGVVVEVNSAGNLIAHCQDNRAWRRKPIYDWLLNQARNTAVFIETAVTDPVVLTADGQLTEMTFVGVDPVTNNRLYQAVLP